MYPSSYSLSTKPPPPKYSDFTGYGWIIVTCSFILYLIVDGIAYNLGLINSAWLTEFKQSETATSWIGSIFYSVPLLSAPITAQLVENFGCKTITIICSIISTFGFVMSSFCGSIEQLYMTVGLIAGFGVSAAYVVGILSAERWFEKNRTLAIGIVSSGTGFGTFLIAPITQRLLDAYGWRNVMYFLASLNVLMGFVGCFMREPQWVIDEMEKKGGRVPKRNENHGILEEHETSFGTFRRLSIEAIEDLKDVVRGHFHENYSHLDEVVEERGVNFDISEVRLLKKEMSPLCETRLVTCSKCKGRLPKSNEFEVRSLQTQQNHLKSPESTKNELKIKKSEVMSAKDQQMSIATPSIHNIENIEQQITINDFQEHINLETNINTIKTETNKSSSAKVVNTNSHVSYDEIENETMAVQLPQGEEEEDYQEENFGSNQDYEALTPIIAAKNIRLDDDDCQCLSRDDVRSKFESDGIQVDQIFTISGQNLGNHPENLKICDHKGKVYVSEQQGLKSGEIDCDCKSGMQHSNFEEHNFKYEQRSFMYEQYNVQAESCPEIMHQNGTIGSRSLESLNQKLDSRKCSPDIGRSLQNPKPGQQNHITKFTNIEKIQPPPCSQACYIFDTNHIKPIPKKPPMTILIIKFIKEKFKVIKKLFSHFSNRDFTLLAISTFAIYALYNIPIYFIIELLKNYGYTEPQCANFISLIGISILIGMITLGYIGDVSGNHVKNVNALCVLICGISEILLPSCAVNTIAFSICCFFFGFSFASAYVLIPKIAEMIVGVEEFASAIGLNFFVQGLALLVGIPFASTIYEAIGSWKITFEICGTIISFGSIFAYLVKVKRD